MSKIIINNESSLDELTAISRVARVIKGGFVSKGENGEQYCFVTTFEDSHVFAWKTKSGSHVFRVSNSEDHDEERLHFG